MTLKLYKYFEDFGRMGYLSGVFVADDADVEEAMGEEVYLGEVLGKHSEVTATVSDETIKVLTDDAKFIQKFSQIGASSGTNPISAYFDNKG